MTSKVGHNHPANQGYQLTACPDDSCPDLTILICNNPDVPLFSVSTTKIGVSPQTVKKKKCCRIHWTCEEGYQYIYHSDHNESV